MYCSVYVKGVNNTIALTSSREKFCSKLQIGLGGKCSLVVATELRSSQVVWQRTGDSPSRPFDQMDAETFGCSQSPQRL